MSAGTRSSWLSLLGWLVPLAFIVAGLAFLAADVTGDDEIGSGATPANAAVAAQSHAASWVGRRVAPPGTAALAAIVPVSATPDGPTLYHLRLVVVSHETLPDVAQTVAWCVRWDVDVSSGVVTELADVELSRDRGLHPATERDGEWQARCAAEVVL